MLYSTIEGGNASFFHLGFLRHSADCRIVAYGVDTTGSERYTTYFMDMDTKELLPDKIPDSYEDFEFDQTGQYCYYLKIDEYERAHQVVRHKLGTDVTQDEVLYDEQDEMFFLTLTKSTNKK